MQCNGFSDCPYAEDEQNCGNPVEGDTSTLPDRVWTLDEASGSFEMALSSGQNVLVDFYAPWCPACVIFEPKYKKAADEAARNGLEITFAKVDTDQNPYLKHRFGIDTFPRLLLFPKNGARPKRYIPT